MNKNNTHSIITTWELRNFQSIRQTQKLDLKPLTIFSGPNSSGKSAVIKSLLMVAQSLDSSVREVPLVLNGKYTQLGDFDHILHHGSDPPEMEFGFVIRGQERTIDVWALIQKDEDSGSMRVTDSTVSWGGSDDESFDLRYNSNKFKHLRDAKEQEINSLVQEEIKRGLFDYEIIYPKVIESRFLYEEAISASLTNFLPGRVLMRIKSDIRKIVEDIEQAREGILSIIDMSSISVELDRELGEGAQSVFGLIGQRLGPDNPLKVIVTDISNSETPWTIRKLKQFLLENLIKLPIATEQPVRHRTARSTQIRVKSQERWVVRLSDQMLRGLMDVLNVINRTGSPRPETELEARQFPPRYSPIIQQIRRFFEDQIFYLGPLRDDPRTIHAIPPVLDHRNVGLKGEYTAAMLDVHKETPVYYPLPPPLGEFSGRYELQTDTLSKAVHKWLERMGLAEDFKTQMTSKVGYQLSVRPVGVKKKDLDLTSLGVGVSQVLPTIVMALLAPADSVLIFEQPEVHLHPKVQSVLGDFFLGIVCSGKQCIVETHSEYLIHRIRRRIAESNDKTILQQLGIYFVKLEDGRSQFTKVKTNEYGAILDLVPDFFDEAEAESAILLSAAMEKWRESEQEDK